MEKSLTMPRADISAVVITYNEEDNIKACLDALKRAVKEVLVLDSYSEDNTVQISIEAGAKVIPTDWLGYAKTKNNGNSYCSNEWILSVDADEVLSEELISTIKKMELKEGCTYLLDRQTNFAGKWIKYSGWYPDWKPRLFHREKVHWQGDFVHETLFSPPQFKLIKLKGKLYHYSYKDLDDHWKRSMKYAKLAAEKMFDNGRREVGFLKKWIAPTVRFFRTYFVKGGIFDGYLGFIISIRDAFMVSIKYRYLEQLIENSKKSK